MLAFPLGIHARADSVPKFTFGAEWGYIGVFYSGYHHNFYAPEGYRVDPRGHEFMYMSNAEGYVHMGYNLDSRYNLSLYIGVSAVMDYHHVIPVSLRLTRYYAPDPMKDRWFSFIDLGSGTDVKDDPQMILTGKVGGGYRISLSRNTKLDLMISLRSVLTHPDIDYHGTVISHDRINRNNAYISAFSVGMALTF